MNKNDLFLLRAIDLANLADRNIKSNPPVGCVIVSGDKIIGEGRHEIFGQAHAEVNAYNDAIKKGNQPDDSSMVYVTLEPCGHYGKTPPCAALLSSFRPKEVIILEKDQHPVTSGRGLEILSQNNVEYRIEEISDQSRLSDRFYKNNFKKQPWVILKFAQTFNGYMASTEGTVQISDPFTSRLTHKWRSLCDGILIGKNTLETDDPDLTNRHWFGPSPQRFVVGNSFSKSLSDYKIFQGEQPAILITMSNEDFGVETIRVENMDWNHILSIMYEEYKICQIMVEGGSILLQSFIDQQVWDEARIITSEKTLKNANIKSPELNTGIKKENYRLYSDTIEILKRSNSYEK